MCSGVLLVGATGHLGGLIASGILAEGEGTIVVPMRDPGKQSEMVAQIRDELCREGVLGDIDLGRLVVVPLPAHGRFHELDETLVRFGVEEIVHCAGSVDYFDPIRLREANIDLTADLLEVARRLRLRRFIFLSTAFSSGYAEGCVPELLHPSPKLDPTEYTRSKRDAEFLVAESGVPYLIVRPSIVIGDSRDGRYTGKPYGIYQFWFSGERFLSDRYRDVMHVVAPLRALPVLHQDSFKKSFMAARRHLAENKIVHLCSRPDRLPTVRALFNLWFETVMCPQQLHHYDRIEDVPLEGLDRRLRTWLEFTAVNSEISGHAWSFESTNLDSLRNAGLSFADATLDTVRLCQDRFVAESSRLTAYLRDYLPTRIGPPVTEPT